MKRAVFIFLLLCFALAVVVGVSAQTGDAVTFATPPSAVVVTDNSTHKTTGFEATFDGLTVTTTKIAGNGSFTFDFRDITKNTRVGLDDSSIAESSANMRYAVNNGGQYYYEGTQVGSEDGITNTTRVTLTRTGSTVSLVFGSLTIPFSTGFSGDLYLHVAHGEVGAGVDDARSVGGSGGSPPAITTTSLPSGTVSSAYSQTIQSSGGVAPRTISVVSGTLPAGLTLTGSTGVVSGTPTVAGTSNFTARVTDSAGTPQTDDQTLSIVINVAGGGGSSGEQGTAVTFQTPPSTVTVTNNSTHKTSGNIGSSDAQVVTVEKLAGDGTFFWDWRHIPQGVGVSLDESPTAKSESAMRYHIGTNGEYHHQNVFKGQVVGMHNSQRMGFRRVGSTVYLMQGATIAHPFATGYTGDLYLHISHGYVGGGVDDVRIQTGTPPSGASNAITTDIFTAYSNVYTVAAEWSFVGDDDHDATCAVEYREQGSGTWLNAMAAVRVDYTSFLDETSRINKFAGKIFNLTPGTAYEVKWTITDPDGGSTSKTFTRTTRAIPTLPTGGATKYVSPVGSGGTGVGTSANPFLGIAAANDSAQPGDTFILAAGNYTGQTNGRHYFSNGGTSTNYVVWKAATGATVNLNGGYTIARSYIWFEGLRFPAATVPNTSFAMLTSDNPVGVVLRKNHFFQHHYGIYLSDGGSDWWIEDNVVVGDTYYRSDSFSGEGIELDDTSGHSISHNTVTYTADGISTPAFNTDVFRNDVYNTADDCIEGDRGRSNFGVWENRCTNTAHNGFSSQPQGDAPWYFIRNQVMGPEESIFKLRQMDRFVFINNTFVMWGRQAATGDNLYLNAILKNNLFASRQGGQWRNTGSEVKSWKTDHDYNGFDWGSPEYPLVYGSTIYYSLASYRTASGLETNGLSFNHATCFPTLDFSVAPPNPKPFQVLSIASGCNVRNAGVVIPNITGSYEGAAPDLGAHEFGSTAPEYGARGMTVPTFSTPPTDPTNFVATANGATQVVLTWGDASSDETYFEARISDTGFEGPHDEILTFAANATTANLNSRTASTAYHINFYACNALGCSGNVYATATTAASGSGSPLITTTALPNGTVGAAYSQTIQSTGGTAPRTISIVGGSGSLPAGLSLVGSTGVVSGTPTAAGTSNFTARVTDSAGTPLTDDQALSIVVNAAGPSSPPNAPTLLAAVRDSVASIAVTFTNNGGSADSIVVEKSADGVTNWTSAATFSGSAVNGTVINLTPATRVYLRAKATNAAGSSGYSNVANAYTALLCRWPFGCL